MNAAAGVPETACSIRRHLRDTCRPRKRCGLVCSPPTIRRKPVDRGTSIFKKPRRLPSCGQCCAQLFLSGLCLIAHLPVIAIDGCRWLHVNPASLSGRSLSMMYFIELSQFLPDDNAVVQALRAQLGPDKCDTMHWAEWGADGSNTRSCPDVTLINAARLDWRRLKSLVDECSRKSAGRCATQKSCCGPGRRSRPPACRRKTGLTPLRHPRRALQT